MYYGEDPFSYFSRRIFARAVTDLIIVLVILIAVYLAFSWLMQTIARKYKNDETFPAYIVPFFRYYKLIQLIGANPLLLIGVSVEIFTLITLAQGMFAFSGLLYLVSVFSLGCFWAAMSKSMGDKDPVIWGFVGGVCAFFYFTRFIPFVYFGFSSKQPLPEYANGAALTNARTTSEAFHSAMNNMNSVRQNVTDKAAQKQARPAQPPQADSVRRPAPEIRQQVAPAGTAVPGQDEPKTEVPGTTVVPGKAEKVTLRCCSGSAAGMEIEITAEPVLLGRDPEVAHLIVNSPDVSRRHAKVSLISDGTVLLEDLDSSNGTYLLKPGSKERVKGVARLKAGDKFAVGLQDNVFEIA